MHDYHGTEVDWNKSCESCENSKYAIPSGEQPHSNGKWPFSIAMLNYQRVILLGLLGQDGFPVEGKA